MAERRTRFKNVTAQAMMTPNSAGLPAVYISWSNTVFAGGVSQRAGWQIYRQDVLDSPVGVTAGYNGSCTDTTMRDKLSAPCLMQRSRRTRSATLKTVTTLRPRTPRIRSLSQVSRLATSTSIKFRKSMTCWPSTFRVAARARQLDLRARPRQERLHQERLPDWYDLVRHH